MLPVSNNADAGARRRRQTLKSCSGFTNIVHGLTFTIVALLTTHIPEVTAFHCENHMHRPTVQNEKTQIISQYCNGGGTGEKSLMICNARHPMHNKKENFLHYAKRYTVVHLSTKDDDIAVQQTNLVTTKQGNDTNTSANDSSKLTTRSSLSRTLVLAIPLMLKFALVLMIKFLTDLVVFPLLFTYRGIRVLKRRISKIWNRWTSSPTSTAVDSTEDSTLNLENYVANGSVPSSNSGTKL